MADDYYAVLGVGRDATSQEIKRAFREIARKCHPDVAGADPAAEEQFRNSRKAYETLMDPVARARYDRRGQRKAPAGGSFFDAFYRATDRSGTPPVAEASRPRPASGKRNPGNSVTLEDLFNDFGDFGFGEGRGGAKPPESQPPRQAPTIGDDVYVDLDVPAGIARAGGSLTAVYYRMQRADSWRPGSPDPGLVRVQDIADIRVVPGTADGELLRERGLGNAGPHGGAYGD
ncbi:MAG: DnaJ domain-containing protein, partial [Myxococcota bacterium]